MTPCSNQRTERRWVVVWCGGVSRLVAHASPRRRASTKYTRYQKNRMNPSSFDEDMADSQEIARTIAVLFDPTPVFEWRVLKATDGHGNQGTVSGCSDGQHRKELAKVAVNRSGKAPAVDVTLNPVMRGGKRRTDALFWGGRSNSCGMPHPEVIVHRGLSRFSRRGGYCAANRHYRRENGTVPLAPRERLPSRETSATVRHEAQACPPLSRHGFRAAHQSGSPHSPNPSANSSARWLTTSSASGPVAESRSSVP